MSHKYGSMFNGSIMVQVWFNENMVSAKYVVESAKLQALKSVIS